MRENRIRTIWAEGGKVLSGWVGLPTSLGAEIMANQDFDAVVVDTQHGMIGFQVAAEMLQAISTTAAVPLARAPWNDPSSIMKLLDAGAYGIVCPMVNNRAQCEAFVGACRYAPQGYRSFGPARGMLYGGEDYLEHANDTLVTLAMIETSEAVEKLDEITTVDGLDAVFIGPADLAISLGCAPSMEPTEKIVVDAIDAIQAAAEKNGVIAGVYCAAGAVAKRWFDRGFRFVAIGSDTRFLASGAEAEIKVARGG
jgi:4-hydroxy-2-oxoheptanedioate aldolase